jgi:hypothetical protein
MAPDLPHGYTSMGDNGPRVVPACPGPVFPSSLWTEAGSSCCAWSASGGADSPTPPGGTTALTLALLLFIIFIDLRLQASRHAKRKAERKRREEDLRI